MAKKKVQKRQRRSAVMKLKKEKKRKMANRKDLTTFSEPFMCSCKEIISGFSQFEEHISKCKGASGKNKVIRYVQLEALNCPHKETCDKILELGLGMELPVVVGENKVQLRRPYVRGVVNLICKALGGADQVKLRYGALTRLADSEEHMKSFMTIVASAEKNDVDNLIMRYATGPVL